MLLDIIEHDCATPGGIGCSMANGSGRRNGANYIRPVYAHCDAVGDKLSFTDCDAFSDQR